MDAVTIKFILIASMLVAVIFALSGTKESKP